MRGSHRKSPERRVQDLTDYELKGRNRCLSSIFWTAWYLGNGQGYRDLSMVLHLAMAIWLQKKLKEGWRRFLVLIPRDYFKTSVLGVALVIWFLINNPDFVIEYTMHREDFSKKKMDEVRAAFESDNMRRFFPEFYVGQEWKARATWNKGEFTIPRENPHGAPSVFCSGITGGQTGSHSNVIVWDDVIKGDADETPGQIEAAMRKAKKVTYLWKDRKRGIWVNLGTLHEGGHYENLQARRNIAKLVLGGYVDERFQGMIKETGVKIPKPDSAYVATRVIPENQGPVLDAGYDDEGQIVFTEPMVNENTGELLMPWDYGTPIFPEHETMKSLEEAREDSGEEFDNQILNQPKGSANRKFDARNFLGFVLKSRSGNPLSCSLSGVEYPYARQTRYCMWDPTGGTGKRPDHCGIVVFGWDRVNALAFVYETFKQRRIEIDDQIAKVVDLADLWDVEYIVPEKAALQIVFERLLKNEIRDRLNKGTMKRYIKIDPYQRTAKAKATWIFDSLSGHVSRKEIAVRVEKETDDVRTHPLVQQAVNLNVRNGIVIGESPELLDCLAMGAKYMMRSRVYEQREDGIKWDRPLVKKHQKRVRAYGLEPASSSTGVISA